MNVADLPPPLALAVTVAAERFAEAEGASVTSWYHDAPIWFIHQVRGDESLRKLIRVQIASFAPASPKELPRLYLLPDAYRLERPESAMQAPRLIPLVEPAWVSARTRTIALYDRDGDLLPSEAIRLELMDQLRAPWSAALEAAQQ